MKTVSTLLNQKLEKMTKVDYLIIGLIIFIYSILSFVNLGSFENPQTFYNFKEDEAITFKLASSEAISKIRIFNGELNGKYAIYLSDDDATYSYATTIEGTGAFSWTERSLIKKANFIKVLSLSDEASLGEVVFYNSKNKPIKVESTISSYYQKIDKLTDEAKKVPDKISYLNSSYFDEIYFARTAYDYANNLEAYEWVHPPLGKLIQAIPVKLFNTMAPFFYRLMGNIAGIIMIFVMYLFGKEIFKTRKWAIFSALLMFFDTFHFAHTRMGTVDSFLVLFIMLSLYFMYRHISRVKSKYNLLLSGLFFGLAVCVKWTAFLAGLALAIIYFTDIFKNKKSLSKAIIRGTCFFVLIPLIIYIGSYLLFPNVQVTYTDSIKDIVVQTGEMYNYHSSLEEPHFFSSKWYTWPLSYKPVWYYTNSTSNTSHGSISGIGNIVIWWLVIITLPYMIYKIFKKKDKASFFITIAILSMWLPYAFIGRVMFLYHYFPVIPMVMLSVVVLFHDIEEKTKNKYIMPIYLLLVIIFFIIYYPVVSGTSASNNYIENLKLLPSWYF